MPFEQILGKAILILLGIVNSAEQICTTALTIVRDLIPLKWTKQQGFSSLTILIIQTLR